MAGSIAVKPRRFGLMKVLDDQISVTTLLLKITALSAELQMLLG